MRWFQKAQKQEFAAIVKSAAAIFFSERCTKDNRCLDIEEVVSQTVWKVLVHNHRPRVSASPVVCAVSSGMGKSSTLGHCLVQTIQVTVIKCGRIDDVNLRRPPPPPAWKSRFYKTVKSYPILMKFWTQKKGHMPSSTNAKAAVRRHFPRWPSPPFRKSR
jgi:hypothetical protein